MGKIPRGSAFGCFNSARGCQRSRSRALRAVVIIPLPFFDGICHAADCAALTGNDSVVVFRARGNGLGWGGIGHSAASRRTGSGTTTTAARLLLADHPMALPNLRLHLYLNPKIA